MALSESEVELCAKWVSAPNHKWQTLNRAQWRYIFHEKTLVRYVDVAKMDEGIVPLLLEYLTAKDGSGGYLCSSTLQLYGQGVSAEWTPVRAWYEITSKAAGSVAGVRLYHALTSEPEEQEDGPYLVEDGCAYKVSLTYYWKVAELPTVPASTSGVSYRLSFQRDPDNGLYTATIEKRERVQQDIPLYLHAETIYEKHQTEQHLGVKQADVATTGLAAGVANGVLTQRTLSKNSDCTTDVSNAVETEKPVSNAVVERSKRLHAVTRSTTDRNQPTAITDTAGTLKVGETVRSQKTPGGLYDNTHVQVDEEEVGVIGEDCSKTIYEHGHKVHSNVAEKPAPEAAAAGGGHVYGKTARQTEYGTWNVTESDSLELPVSEARVSKKKTLHGMVTSTTARNQPLPGPTPSKVGEGTTNQKTPGGLYDVTLDSVEVEPAGKIAESCEKTQFEHQHTEVENKAAPDASEADSASGGVISKVSSRETELGTWDVTTTKTTELPVSEASKRYQKTLHGTVETTVNRNQASALSGGGMKVGETRQSEKTPGGLYNNTQSLVVNEPAGKIGEAGVEDRHSRTVSETVNQMEMEDTAPTFSEGEIVRKTSSMNSDGTADVQTHTVTAKPSMNRYSWTDDNGTHTRISYRNQPTDQTNRIPDSADNSSASDNLNDFGLHDGTVAWFNSSSSSGSGDTIFIRHGPVVKAWQMRMRPPKNIREVREVQLQLTIHYGDAVTDMFSDALQANCNRENNGVVMMKRIHFGGRYRNLAAWISVDLGGIGNWEDFEPDKHGFCPYTESVADIARKMLNGVNV